jgi:uroporphyrinogen-III synthase
MTQAEFDAFSLVVFTSPSSVDALTQHFHIGAHTKVAAIGNFTAHHLQDRGFGDRKVLPKGTLPESLNCSSLWAMSRSDELL